MNNTNNNTNICFVFSQQTLDIAIDEWVEERSESSPAKKEAFMITKAALPWFMRHLNQSGSIYMFSAEDMKNEIESWKKAQFTAFPKRKKRIEETCDLLISFFESDLIETHKMTVNA
ncbi:hypothetical protein OO007_15520 [Cocleimonas sp. KMM 6892]|uniref:hypothetical protein n=1 Tax=unclassified Cocleimonas TaxID=2639732 RepID=UPI002DB8A45B|nr:MULTISPECIES: hypothetical protein [unclassified Cocleimonas]MEB8433648.1 hypothetical protein [Cocleimonas sp. KMM 6892]MEC4716459.1 hypothetical protein [Cocleimonas sp. KMM 6895]MEC4745648.1 hypothetical protein [Cocleimonas sp. KMM 6896]